VEHNLAAILSWIQIKCVLAHNVTHDKGNKPLQVIE
jgi:hypothetical protein